ncbi:MAG: hypothetical protein KAT33_08630 [Bacteroidales bacterium]|nr:hypothetical protein [Bacteroidales bacterium]
MAEYFSFTDQQLVNILNISGLLIHGIEKVVAIYYDYNLEDIYAKCYKRNSTGSQVEDFMIEDGKNLIQKLRKEKTSYNWYKKEELPFDIKEADKLKMEVFDEFENIVLLLRYFNEHDKKHDLIFFYFNKNVGNFGVCSSDKSLSTENKSIIANLLFNSIKTIIETNSQNLQIWQLLNENTKSIIQNYYSVKEELKIIKKSFGQSLINLCCGYIKEFSAKRNKDYKLTEDALKKISEYNGDINNLKSTIERTLLYVDNTRFDSDNEVFEINDWDINFYDYDFKAKPDDKNIMITNKYTKTILLLDKLENASQEVKSKNYNLTSVNVGNLCPTPISAPAISDALRKHRKKILYLMKKHPEKWRIIRKEFRPLLNIIAAKPDLEDYFKFERS